MATPPDPGPPVPQWFRRWLCSRRAAVVLLWVVAALVACQRLDHARTRFRDKPTTPDHERRADGNSGHAQIDFGGQWVMGRMLLAGRGRELYHRQRQWEVVREAFPVADEGLVTREDTAAFRHRRRFAAPGDDVRHDADALMYWFMGSDPPAWKAAGGAVAAPLATSPFAAPLEAAAFTHAAGDRVDPDLVAELEKPTIGGPLYPPVHAFFYAPLALERPQAAYFHFQYLSLAFGFAAGFGAWLLTGRRVWASVCCVGVFLFPGFAPALDLGQNSVLTLAVLVWGWVLAARGRDWAGGAVWGLLAFKPVWAAAFFLVPLLMGRWRFCLAMIGTGAALGLATLPFVGLQPWFDWLAVGKEAAELYKVNQNWVSLGRDLQNLPRRFLIDFNLPEPDRDVPGHTEAGWALWAVVFAATAVVYRLRADRRKAVGLGAGFLFLGAYLTCYRFMYYDALLAFVGVAVLFAEPWRFFRGTEYAVTPAGDRGFGPRLVGRVNSFALSVIGLLLLLDLVFHGMDLGVTLGFGYYAHPTTGPGGATKLATPRFEAGTSIDYPWETVLVLALWGWCGWRLLRGDDRAG